MVSSLLSPRRNNIWAVLDQVTATTSLMPLGHGNYPHCVSVCLQCHWSFDLLSPASLSPPYDADSRQLDLSNILKNIKINTNHCWDVAICRKYDRKLRLCLLSTAPSELYVGAPHYSLSGSNYLWASDLITIMTVIPNINDNNLTDHSQVHNSTLLRFNDLGAHGVLICVVQLTHSLEDTASQLFS